MKSNRLKDTMGKTVDYSKTVAQIEKMLETIENPETPVPEVEKLIVKARTMLADAKLWLRTEKENIVNTL